MYSVQWTLDNLLSVRFSIILMYFYTFKNYGVNVNCAFYVLFWYCVVFALFNDAS